MNDEKCVVPVPTMSARIAPLTATGGEGTTDYNKLKNKPSINDIPLQGNKTLDDLGIQPIGDYASLDDIPTELSELNNDVGYITDYVETDPTVPDYVKSISEDDIARWNAGGGGGEGTSDYNALTNKPKINGKVLLDDVSLEEIGAQPADDYALKSDIPDLTDYPKKEEVDKRFEGIEHDFETYDELVKELQDKKEIYVGYISSITPGRDAIEKILGDAIKSGAGTLILRPTVDLPQDFTAIGSGPNLQKYKNGGKGLIKFTDVNEHTTINAMPSVISYVTTVSFTVTTQEDTIDVTITDVQTKFISGINSTSQQAYVLHTKNEEEYTPTKDYHPAVLKTVKDSIENFKSNVLTKDNTMEYEPTTDYNPTPKIYVDRVRNDIPTRASQLENDMVIEAKSAVEGLELSKQNPGKFVLWGGEE